MHITDITPALLKDIEVIYGVDPGTNTGVTSYTYTADNPKGIFNIDTMTATDFIIEIVRLSDEIGPSKIFVAFEDARLAKYGWNNFRAQGAGSIKRDCKILEDFLKNQKILYCKVRPDKRMNKLGAYKNLKIWQGIFKWPAFRPIKRQDTTEHARIAALIAQKFDTIKKRKLPRKKS